MSDKCWCLHLCYLLSYQSKQTFSMPHMEMQQASWSSGNLQRLHCSLESKRKQSMEAVDEKPSESSLWLIEHLTALCRMPFQVVKQEAMHGLVCCCMMRSHIAAAMLCIFSCTLLGMPLLAGVLAAKDVPEAKTRNRDPPCLGAAILGVGGRASGFGELDPPPLGEGFCCVMQCTLPAFSNTSLDGTLTTFLSGPYAFCRTVTASASLSAENPPKAGTTTPPFAT